MMRLDSCRCRARSCGARRRDFRCSWNEAATNGSACPVMPDIEEERMLRALVFEGLSVARRAPFRACFRRWLVRVAQNGSFGAVSFTVTVEIRCRQRMASCPASRFLLCCQAVLAR
ncbi:hypothetical protein BUPH_08196 (plasmid) [Paraburkholderia phenoliruptrix BR3459a]|uniref:Uncharacterized protein n=1 Tax=Paraburkholderia phenoliruptrix BR3459a TaxID=1229205 RepID=K0E0P5_9BURK|nr:hypothetical protein BUPH_08196 [Paraburkholderia phenoliruptrix BR3459a]